MGTSGQSVWFVGDLDDPWVASIADALPGGSRRIACPGDLPDPWPLLVDDRPRAVVLHRAILTSYDLDRLAALRSRLAPTTRVILCVGPHVRHVDLERWVVLGLVDSVIHEAIARDTI